MPQKVNLSYDERLKLIADYLNGKIGFCEAVKKYSRFQFILEQYKYNGTEGLKLTEGKNNSYPASVKLSAVTDYVSGKGSKITICAKYKISSRAVLDRWIKVYNDSHKELKSTGSGGRKPMTKARKTTFDERIEIVKFCIANSKNYGMTMDKFNVSYQQIYLWVRKYEEKGVDGLLDRRGKAKPENELTELDRLKAENKMLAAKNQELQMEIDIIKKLKEVERRYR